ncbi:MAG: PilZ domain-containing protein [Desulfobacteraceae bacterium]|jgi:Tfp pilus assembly protein PilZ|nr:PilZ domain-containing protein [Desulfobacteraceae bacterium]
MKVPETALKKYNVVIPKLFQIILNLPEEKQLALLQHAEELLVRERRAFIRKTCSIPVSYATYDRVYSNTIKNISQKGVFIETQRPLFVGEELILSFSMPGFGKPLKVKGEIVQVSRSGIGVEFKSMSPYVEEMIAKLINRMKTELV